VAVVLVMTAHVGEFLVRRDPWWLVPGGFLGVDVFFVLSGYLITTLLEREIDRRGSVDLRAFWRRRVVRLAPALYVFLVVHVVYVAVVGDALGLELRSVAFAAAYVADYQLSVGSHPPFDLVHLWTLAVEMQFYLAWPVLLPWLRRHLSPDRLLALLAAAVVVVAGVRWIEFHAWTDWTLVYERLDARADSLLVGAVLALAMRRWPTARWHRDRALTTWLGIAGVAVVAMFVLTQRPGASLLFGPGFTVMAIAVACVIVAGSYATPLQRALSVRPLRAVGRISYSLYLWHLPVFVATARWGDSWPTPVQVLFVVAVTAVLGTASYLVLERPVLHRPPLAASPAAGASGAPDDTGGAVGTDVPREPPVVGR